MVHIVEVDPLERREARQAHIGDIIHRLHLLGDLELLEHWAEKLLLAGYIVPVIFIERPRSNLNPRNLGVQHAPEHILQVRSPVRLLLPIDQGDGRHHIVGLILRLHGYMRARHPERALLVVEILGNIMITTWRRRYVLELLHPIAIVGHHLQIYHLVLLAAIHRGHATEL